MGTSNILYLIILSFHALCYTWNDLFIPLDIVYYFRHLELPLDKKTCEEPVMEVIVVRCSLIPFPIGGDTNWLLRRSEFTQYKNVELKWKILLSSSEPNILRNLKKKKKKTAITFVIFPFWKNLVHYLSK